MKTLILQEMTDQQLRADNGREPLYFTLATWLKSDRQYSSEFRLMISYTDREGEHRVEIDKASNLTESVLLLSGAVVLRPSAPLTKMRVLLECSSPMARVMVENLNVQRVRRGDGVSAAA